MIEVCGIKALQAWVGRSFGTSPWLRVEQARIRSFAEVTGDDQWIHVDVERATRSSPWHGTIAHGYLTLSLLPLLNRQIMRVEGVRAQVNYGLDRVRFPQAVPAGARVRSHLRLQRLEASSPQRAMAYYRSEVEVEGAAKPACVADHLVMYLI